MTKQKTAQAMLATRTMSELLTCWALTEVAEMTPELPTVRGWIMDELQRRDPEAYDRWMDDENPDAQPDTYFRR